MTTLTTTAVIRAHDALTGPLAAMASRVNSIHGRFASGARRMGAAGQSLGIGLVGGVYGFQAIMDKAEEFNKAIFGIGAANLPSLVGEDGKADTNTALRQMAEIEAASMGLSRELRMSATDIAKISETLAKAGMGEEQMAATTRAAATLSKTDLETPANNMADFLHTLSVIQKQADGESFGNFIKRQADMTYAAAATTKLSVGSIMEGMRQFQTIGAGMGLKTEEMLALVMGGAQRGFTAVELGTALKSDMVRALKPTAEGQAALTSILNGQGKNLSDFAQLDAIDPTRALSNLSRALGISFEKGKSGNFKKGLGQMLFDAHKGGYTGSDAFIDKMTAKIVKHKGITDHEGMQNVRNAVVNSIMSPTGGFRFMDLLRTLVEGGATDGQLASIFEGKQLARNKAFTDMFRKGDNGVSEYDQYVQMLRRMNGQGLDAVETLWTKSSIGNVTAMQAAWERLTVSLANAPGLQRFVNFAERAADALGRLNPELIDLGMRATALSLLASPIVNAARGLGAIAGAAAASAVSLSRLVALPFDKVSKLLGALGVANFAAGRIAGSPLARMLSPVATVLGRIAGFSAPFLAVAGAYTAFQKWDKISAFFDKLANSNGVATATAAMERLWSALSPMANALLSTAEGLAKMFGLDFSGSALLTGLDHMIGLFGNIVDVMARAIEKFNEWTGLTANPVTADSPIGSQTGRWKTGPRGGQTYIPNEMYGPPAPDISSLAQPILSGAASMGSAAGQLSGTASALDGSAASLRSAAEAISSAAGRIQSPTVIQGGGGTGQAAAPAPRTDNGAQHNGGR